jgi:hypothetical protein
MLSPNTNYDWGVRAVCSGGSITDWKFSNFWTIGGATLQPQGGGTQENLLDNNILPAQVKVFPNPAAGGNTVTVVLNNQWQNIQRITLFSLTGQVIQRVENVEQPQHQMLLNSDVSAGAYILRVEGADFSVAKRLLIQ